MGIATTASAQDANILSAGAVEPGLLAALALYQKESGRKPSVTFNTAPQIRERVEKKGEKSEPPPTAGKVEIGFKNGTPTFVPAPTGRGVEFDGNLFFDAGPAANFDYRDRLHDFKDRFAISAWIYPAAENSGAIVTRMRDSAEAKENGLPKIKGYGVFATQT